MMVANWTTGAESNNAVSLAKALAVHSRDINGLDVILCPPFASLTAVRSAVAAADIALGAPSIIYKERVGELTAELRVELSAAMLSHRLAYAIIGHWRWEDDNPTVALETAVALRNGIRPVICVSDTIESHRAGEPIEATIHRQVERGLSQVKREPAPGSLIIAYEPAWAIRSNQLVAAREASTVLGVVRAEIAQKFGNEVATSMPVLYGGNLNPSNAVDFAACGFNGALLTGDDNLDAATFLEIAKAFSSQYTEAGRPPFIPSESELVNGDVVDDPLTPEQLAVSRLLKRSLLPVISELENALHFLGDREAEGLRLIREKLDDFAQWERIARLGEIGEQFNTDIHHAIGTDERPDYPSRAVVEVLQPGYRVEDTIVQKAEVIVNR